MATLALVDAVVSVNAKDLSSDGVKVDLEYSADELEDTAFGDTTKSRIGGLKDWGGTFEFNQDVGKVRLAARITATSNFQDWFGGRLSIEIREDVISLGGYGKTLTVLYEIDMPDEDDEDEEELIESWTPRFRR